MQCLSGYLRNCYTVANLNLNACKCLKKQYNKSDVQQSSKGLQSVTSYLNNPLLLWLLNCSIFAIWPLAHISTKWWCRRMENSLLPYKSLHNFQPPKLGMLVKIQTQSRHNEGHKASIWTDLTSSSWLTGFGKVKLQHCRYLKIWPLHRLKCIRNPTKNSWHYNSTSLVFSFINCPDVHLDLFTAI